MSQLYLTAAQIETAVRTFYKGNGYVILSQVRNGTGFSRAARTADMLAVSTWPSRGLFAEGIEIKSDKGDLRRELGSPEKAEEIAKYCSWWKLAVPVGLTDGLLIPPKWGVLQVDANLKTKESHRGALLTPAPMDELFICSVLRSFSEGLIPSSEVQAMVVEARRKERIDTEALCGHRLKELEKGIADFKDRSGVDLMERHGHLTWQLGNIAEAVKLIVNLQGRPIEEIARAQHALQTGLAAIEAALTIMDKTL